jgi:hypothetical protein
MGKVILESLGVALIGSASYLISKYVKIAPIDRNLSPAANQLYFFMIPLLSYLSFRILFELAMWLSTKVKRVAPKYLGKLLSLSLIVSMTISMRLC